MSNAIISLKNVYKKYTLYPSLGGGYKLILTNFIRRKFFNRTYHDVLHGISFDIHEGESVGIIGRNGAGKSTLLGMLAGVLLPSRGDIKIRRSVFAMLELGSGFHPDLTGRENIMLNGVLLGMLSHEIASKIQAIIDFSELESFIEQPIRTYSSGMLARLGFSILVQLNPEILLLDEVFAVGDVHFQEKCRKALLDLKQKKDVTIIMVSHDMPSVLMLCERVIWIDDGRIRMDGAAKDVAQIFKKENLQDGVL